MVLSKIGSVVKAKKLQLKQSLKQLQLPMRPQLLKKKQQQLQHQSQFHLLLMLISKLLEKQQANSAGAAKKCRKLFFVTVSALSCLTLLLMLKVLQLLTKRIPMTMDGTWIIQCGQDGILKALAASQVRSLSAVISKRSLSAKHVHVEQCLYQDKEEN